MQAFLERYWIFFFILSAILMIGAFYPFRLLGLIFIALVPLFYFLHSYAGSRNKIFWGSFIFGIIFSFSISYATLIQFHWIPDAYLFTWTVRLLSIPIAIISGLIGGSISLLFVRLRSYSAISNAMLLAVLWVAGEGIFYMLLSWYHLGILGYAASPMPYLVGFAALGGVLFVSLIIALINSFIAAALSAYVKNERIELRNVAVAAIIIGIFFISIYSIHERYVTNPASAPKNLSIAIIQNKNRAINAFGEFKNNIFTFPHLETLLEKAALEKPDLIIYPFAPFVGAISEEESPSASFDRNVIVGSKYQFAEWAKKYILPDVPFITWNNVFRGLSFYNELNVWKNGELVSFYQKRSLFPFMDYTPAFAKKIGLFSTSFDATPGTKNQKPIVFNATRVEPLICSEVHNSLLVSQNTDIILSLGSDAMFLGDSVGHFDLVNAQYRAAEYRKPAIRGNRFGPSALIDERGRIIAKMEAGEEGVLFGTISYSPNARQTLYARIGDWGFWGFAGIYVLFALWLKRRHQKAKF